MGDHHHGAAASYHLQGIDHFAFSAVVQGAGGFIKHQNAGVAIEGPGQGKTLPLTTRELVAIFPNRRQQAIGQISHVVRQLSGFESLPNLVVIDELFINAKGHIGPDTGIEQLNHLRHLRAAGLPGGQLFRR